mgnify:FL=1|jgi:hypothetical protein
MNRSNMNKQVTTPSMGKGLAALKKEAPEVVKSMGYSGGGVIKGKVKARGVGAATQGYSFKV